MEIVGSRLHELCVLLARSYYVDGMAMNTLINLIWISGRLEVVASSRMYHIIIIIVIIIMVKNKLRDNCFIIFRHLYNKIFFY